MTSDIMVANVMANVMTANDWLVAICQLLAGLGAFLLGFSILSGNIEKMATGKMRSWFNKTAKSKLTGVGIGAASTALVQSSAITTVMTIGLVNAGIMSLYQATTIIMGANIGTTITAQIVALQALDITLIASALTAIGVFMIMLAKKDRTKTIGYTIAGLGIVFVGLEFMSGAMGELKNSDAVLGLLESAKNPFLLLLIGIVLTAMMQSSSALTSIIITMAGGGLIIGGGGNCVLYLILGSNIGSCVTALISSVGTSANAKRVAFIHLMFNVLGAVIFMVMLLIWTGFMDSTFAVWFPNVPQTQIAMFHTFFNLICVCLFIPFTSVFVKVATFVIKDDKKGKEKAVINLDERILRSPGVAIGMILDETKRMAGIAMRALELAVQGFLEKKNSNYEQVQELIKDTSSINNAITKYLVKISAQNISYRDEKIVSSVHSTLSDIERLAELSDNITRYTKHYIDYELVFSDQVIVDLGDMFGKTKQLFEEAMKSFELNDKHSAQLAEALENDIDNYRRTLIDGHIKRLNEGKCKPESSSVFINLVGNLERAGDHLLYIAHAFDNVH